MISAPGCIRLTLGRFLQTDPIGVAGGVNLYAYVGNDPLNLIDPYGLCDSPLGCAAAFGQGIANRAYQLFQQYPNAAGVAVAGRNCGDDRGRGSFVRR